MLTLTQDQFAVFISDLIKDIKVYNFDVFYDIAKIVNEYKSKCGYNDNIPNKDSYFIFYRETGFDMININSDLYEIMYANNSFCYRLDFCFNCDYFRNESFVKIYKIK